MKEIPGTNKNIWNIPYIDQPVEFWKLVHQEYGDYIKEVYFPIPDRIIPSGRPVQPSKNTEEFLSSNLFDLNILINPIIISKPVEEASEIIVPYLKEVCQNYRITSVTVANLTLAMEIRKEIPGLIIVASVLMDIFSPFQLEILDDVFDVIVPSSRIFRDISALKELKRSYQGRIRLIVNEGCLPGCPFRVQHFYEMSTKLSYPKSLCFDILREKPWLRLTGSWILPQHLHLLDGIYDELKLSGRVTLQDHEKYIKILDSYIHKKELLPNEIGGGPASVLKPISISEDFCKHTLKCKQNCEGCMICREYPDLNSSEIHK